MQSGCLTFWNCSFTLWQLFFPNLPSVFVFFELGGAVLCDFHSLLCPPLLISFVFGDRLLQGIVFIFRVARMSKPQCGGGAAQLAEYDLPLHVGAVFLVFAFSIAGAGLPVVGKRVSWAKLPNRVIFFCKHFGTGVLIATAFVHLVPTAFQSLSDPCLPSLLTDDYPAMPGVIVSITQNPYPNKPYPATGVATHTHTSLFILLPYPPRRKRERTVANQVTDDVCPVCSVHH